MTAAARVGNVDRTQVVLRGTPSDIGASSIAQIEVTQVTQGLTGGPGGTAPGTGDANYVHEQAAASASWLVQHNLAKYPSVSVVDSAGDECEGEVRYLTSNQLRISFSGAFSGRAFIN